VDDMQERPVASESNEDPTGRNGTLSSLQSHGQLRLVILLFIAITGFLKP
jgi:hypothetical protein